MTAVFDPSAFIAAEVSQSVATRSDTFTMSRRPEEMADFRAFRDDGRQSVATVATVAGGEDENHPWSADLIEWASRRPPAFAKPILWDELTNEALSISRIWGAKAIAAGWSSLDLFGCYKRPLFRRLDCNGLVANIVGLLTPVRVTEITPDYAELQDYRGTILRHRRFDKSDSVHLWEAYVMTNGP